MIWGNNLFSRLLKQVYKGLHLLSFTWYIYIYIYTHTKQPTRSFPYRTDIYSHGLLHCLKIRLLWLLIMCNAHPLRIFRIYSPANSPVKETKFGVPLPKHQFLADKLAASINSWHDVSIFIYLFFGLPFRSVLKYDGNISRQIIFIAP